MLKKLFGKKTFKSEIPPICQNKFSGKILENPRYLYINNNIMNNIEKYRKRFNSLLESTMGDVRPLINEEFETTGTTETSGSTPTLVAGPLGKGYLKRYVYKENDRFFIYYSTFKNPEHKPDTSREDITNNGQGFETKDEAISVILQNTPN